MLTYVIWQCYNSGAGYGEDKFFGHNIWDHSSAGRAPALQAGGHRFEPYWSHLLKLIDNLRIYNYGGIAQLARAHGSYPWCRWFKSSSRYCKRISFMRFFFCDIGKFILSYITKPSGRIRTRVSRSSQQKLTTLGAQSVQAPHE